MKDFPHQYWVLCCFLYYVQSLGGIILEHSIHFHHHADDLQLYAHFDLNKSSLESTMQNCIYVASLQNSLLVGRNEGGIIPD